MQSAVVAKSRTGIAFCLAIAQEAIKGVTMDLSYIRSRARQFRTTENDAERQALLQKLAAHLGLVQPGADVTQDDRRKVIAELKRLGISAKYRRKN